MALPVIKAKTYNYGSYANPQQVRFKQEFGASLGETVGKAVGQVAGAFIKKQKLDKLKEAQDTRDRLATENKFIEENAPSYYEVYGKENAYSFSEFMKDNITYDEDSVDMKFQKKINRENLLNVGNLIDKLDNDGIDYTDKTMIANLSSVDLQNIYDKNAIKNGALIVRTDKSTNPPSMKYFLPDYSPDYSKTFKIDKTKQPGQQFVGQPTEREVDIMSIFNHKLTPKYNDNVLTDEKYMLANEDSLKNLSLDYVKQDIRMSEDNINGRIYEVIDTEKLFEDPNINFTPGINAIINDYGESIWVDTEDDEKSFVGPYTGSDEQKEKIRKKLTKDLKEKIGKFRLSSTKYTVPEGEESSSSSEDFYNKVNKAVKTESGLKKLIGTTINLGGGSNRILEVKTEFSPGFVGSSDLKGPVISIDHMGLTEGEKAPTFDLGDKDDFARLMRLTNGFGEFGNDKSGRDNINAIIADYDNLSQITNIE